MNYQNYNQANSGWFGGQNRWNGYSAPGSGRVYAQMQWESPEQEVSSDTDSEAVTTVDGIEETEHQDNTNTQPADWESRTENHTPMDWESWTENHTPMDWERWTGNQPPVGWEYPNGFAPQDGITPQNGFAPENDMPSDMSNPAGEQQLPQMPSSMNRNGALPAALDENQQRDLEYFESMYPVRVKKIKIYVNAACDGLEYKGSPMYDEYPDRVVIDRLVDRIMDRMMADGLGEEPAETEAAEEETYEATVFPPYGWGGRPDYPDNRNNWMRDVAAVLLFNEFFRRRCRNCGPRRFY